MDSTAASMMDEAAPLEISPENTAVEIDAFDKLLSNIKSEAMFELRRLKHQQRPVSEFSSKQQLEEFFCKRMPPPQLDVSPAGSAAASDNASLVADRAKQLDSISSASQDFTPQGIRLEVRGLFERRRVTETLQGPLRQEIDHTLRQGLERRQRRQQGRRNRSGHRRRGEADNSPATVRHGRHSARAAPRRHVRFNLPENGQYPMPQRDQGMIVDSLMQSPALNSLNPESREEIVSEVRNLVQQQLVTSALSGEFRGVLELNIQQRLNRTQQGQSGEDFIRSLRQGRSSPRASAAVPGESSGASHGEYRQEMREMKSQLEELKQMMKVSFDLQLDIQRSIRQEVAAALSAFLTQPQQQQGGASSLPQQPCPIPTLTVPEGHASIVQTTAPTVPVVDCGNCVICSDCAIDSVLYRCGHMCMCITCGMDMKSKGLKCPVCRAPITDVIRAYASML